MDVPYSRTSKLAHKTENLTQLSQNVFPPSTSLSYFKYGNNFSLTSLFFYFYYTHTELGMLQRQKMLLNKL